MDVKTTGVNEANKVAKTTGAIVETGERIYNILEKSRVLRIESREVTIRVPERYCIFNVAVSVNRHGLYSKKISLPIGNVESLAVHSLGSSRFARLDDAVIRVPDGFELSIERIPKGVEGILMTFEYSIQDMSFLRSIVQSNVATEPSEDYDSYWMHAALKHPKWFVDRYERWELQDVDFNVDVAIDNEVKSTIPKNFVRHLGILRRIAGETDRNLLHSLTLQLLRSRRGIRGDPNTLINSVEALFDEMQFRRFIEITQPFRYSESKKGSEFLDFPTQVFPKTMEVTCRTKLDLKTPACDGKLFYKKRDLYNEISKIFGL